MKAIILEDEQLASKRLLRLLAEVVPDIEVLDVFESIEDTADYLNKTSDVDLLFLDIHVADGNSFELFNLVEVKSKVIFITAYDKYAIDAFRKNATDYILKPVKKEILAEAISKATPISPNLMDDMISKFKKRIVIKFMSKLHSIKSDDISYIFSKNKVSYVVTKDGERYPSDYKLQELEEMLDPKYFFRANRQFVINIDSIDTIHRHQASRVRLELIPPTKENVVVSTDKTPIFKNWLDR